MQTSDGPSLLFAKATEEDVEQVLEISPNRMEAWKTLLHRSGVARPLPLAVSLTKEQFLTKIRSIFNKKYLRLLPAVFCGLPPSMRQVCVRMGDNPVSEFLMLWHQCPPVERDWLEVLCQFVPDSSIDAILVESGNQELSELTAEDVASEKRCRLAAIGADLPAARKRARLAMSGGAKESHFLTLKLALERYTAAVSAVWSVLVTNREVRATITHGTGHSLRLNAGYVVINPWATVSDDMSGITENDDSDTEQINVFYPFDEEAATKLLAALMKDIVIETFGVNPTRYDPHVFSSAAPASHGEDNESVLTKRVQIFCSKCNSDSLDRKPFQRPAHICSHVLGVEHFTSGQRMSNIVARIQAATSKGQTSMLGFLRTRAGSPTETPGYAST